MTTIRPIGGTNSAGLPTAHAISGVASISRTKVERIGGANWPNTDDIESAAVIELTRQRDAAREIAAYLEDENARLLAAIAAVLDVHRPMRFGTDILVSCGECFVDAPCTTAALLTAALPTLDDEVME